MSAVLTEEKIEIKEWIEDILGNRLVVHNDDVNTFDWVIKSLVEICKQFLKKAAGKVYFVCEKGDQISDAVRQTILSGEGVEVKANSTGKLQDGTPVSNFIFTWSFKAKTK